MKKKSTPTGTDPCKHKAAMETEIFRDHLAIVEHLAVTRYDDGDPREPGYVIIRTSGPLWVADVKDPDSACSFRLSASTIDELLESLQELLDTEKAPWEPDKYLQDKPGQKRKK